MLRQPQHCNNTTALQTNSSLPAYLTKAWLGATQHKTPRTATTHHPATAITASQAIWQCGQLHAGYKIATGYTALLHLPDTQLTNTQTAPPPCSMCTHP